MKEFLEVKIQTIYLVPHSHHDVAWAFTKEDYLEITEPILQKAYGLGVITAEVTSLAQGQPYDVSTTEENFEAVSIIIAAGSEYRKQT